MTKKVRSGKKTAQRARAEKLALYAVNVLHDDPQALALVAAAVRLLASRSRSRRR